MYGRAALQGVGGVGEAVLGEEVVEEDAGAAGGFLREGDGALGGGDGGFGVVGEVEGDVLGGGGGGGGDGVRVNEGGDAFVRLLAAAQEEEGHRQAADGEEPEEDALVARDHGLTPGAAPVEERVGAFWVRHCWRAMEMAVAMRCW